MSKKEKDWVQIAAGIGIIAFSVGNTPLIPDEVVAIPLGLGLIGSGLGFI
jgi:hypothetical protein